MHAALLHTHNLLRWVVLVAGAYAIVKAFSGLSGDKPYAVTRRATAMFMGSVHLNLLLGLLLFLFSPTVKASMRDMAATMANKDLRFIIAEHPTLMVLAAILVTFGSIFSKGRATDAARHKSAAIFMTITLVVILAGIPWQRALFPGM
jgi:uncharacterized membrane protein